MRSDARAYASPAAAKRSANAGRIQSLVPEKPFAMTTHGRRDGDLSGVYRVPAHGTPPESNEIACA